MRKIKILNINAGAQGSIEIAGDFTQVFQGKFYRNPESGETQSFFVPSETKPIPSGFNLIRATTFDVVENTKFYGRYTVFTPVAANDPRSTVFSNNRTRINVNEPISGLDTAPADFSAGYITNISTYLLESGTMKILVPPTVNITSYPIDFMGRDSAGWGETFAQNFLNLATNFANPNAPINPFVGQTWYDTDDKQIRVWQGTTWELLNKASYGVTHHHTQGTEAITWTINHGLGLPAPHIAFCQIYVERGNGPQVIIPSRVEFVNANQMRVTFSNPEIGYVLVRP